MFKTRKKSYTKGQQTYVPIIQEAWQTKKIKIKLDNKPAVTALKRLGGGGGGGGGVGVAGSWYHSLSIVNSFQNYCRLAISILSR